MEILDICALPIPWKRPGYAKRGSHIFVYDQQKKEKAQTKWLLRGQYGGAILTVPIHMNIIFYLPIPKSTSKKKRREMNLGLISAMHKPDVDNLVKFYMDCMTDVIYMDDAQVVDLHAQKKYADNPHVLISFSPLNEKEVADYEEMKEQSKNINPIAWEDNDCY